MRSLRASLLGGLIGVVVGVIVGVATEPAPDHGAFLDPRSVWPAYTGALGFGIGFVGVLISSTLLNVRHRERSRRGWAERASTVESRRAAAARAAGLFALAVPAGPEANVDGREYQRGESAGDGDSAPSVRRPGVWQAVLRDRVGK